MIKNKKIVIAILLLIAGTAVLAVSTPSVNVELIPAKEAGDVITAEEFNTIIGTMEGLKNINGSIGIGKDPTSDVLLDVNSGVKIGFQDSECDSTLAGTTRYNESNSDLEFCNGIEWVSIRNNSKKAMGGCETFETPVINIDGYNYILDGNEANVLAFCKENSYIFGALSNPGDFVPIDEIESKHCAFWNGLKWQTHAGCHTAYKIECCDPGSDFLPTCLDNEILSFDELNKEWKCSEQGYQIVGGGYRYEGDYAIGKEDICNSWGEATCNHDSTTHQLLPPFCPAESTELITGSTFNENLPNSNNITSIYWQCLKSDITITNNQYSD